MHFAFEQVLLLHRVAAEERLLAYLNQSDAALVLRADCIYHIVILGCIVDLHIGHVTLVNLGHMLEESVLTQVPKCDRTVSMATHEVQTVLVYIHRRDPASIRARVVHQWHHFLLGFDVEDADDSLVVSDEHEILEKADALADTVQLVPLRLQFPRNLVVLFIQQELALDIVKLLVKAQQLL